MDLRAQVRRHTRDRLQERAGRPPLLAEPAAAERFLPGGGPAIAGLPVDDVILDGEATWGWESLGNADYYVFDILRLDGRDLTALPLVERRAILNDLPFQLPLAHVSALDDPKPWERACAEGWEGVIAKRRDSTYEHRRSKQWLKMKCEETHLFVVGGFTDPQGKRVGLGALLVGYFAPHESSGVPEPESKSEGRTCALPGRSAPVSTTRCCSSFVRGWTGSRYRKRRSPGPRACHASARIGCARRSSSRLASSNGPGTGSCVIPGLLRRAAATRRPREASSARDAERALRRQEPEKRNKERPA